MEDKKVPKKAPEAFRFNDEVNLRTILQNAIRMQALYSGRRVRIIETSTQTN